MKNSILHLVGFLVLLVSRETARSASETYWDFGTFAAACDNVPGTPVYVPFEGYSQGTGDGYHRLFPNVDGSPPYPNVSIGGVTFEARAPMYIEFPWNYQGYLWDFDGGPITIHFRYGARAFGALFTSNLSDYFATFTATITLDTGEKFTFKAPTAPKGPTNAPPQFFGFISARSVTNVTFSDGSLLNGVGEPMIGAVLTVLNAIPVPRLSITISTNYWGTGSTGMDLSWPADNFLFYAQGSPDLNPTNWVSVAPTWATPTEWLAHLYLPAPPTMFYRLVLAPETWPF